MNAMIMAIEAAKKHVESFTAGTDVRTARRTELEKLSKKELIEMVMSTEKFQDIKIEDIVKPILEDPACAWLDYDTIAKLVKTAVPTANTSSKSLASYASKYPRQKGWSVVPRKTAAERQQAVMSLINL